MCRVFVPRYNTSHIWDTVSATVRQWRYSVNAKHDTGRQRVTRRETPIGAGYWFRYMAKPTITETQKPADGLESRITKARNILGGVLSKTAIKWTEFESTLNKIRTTAETAEAQANAAYSTVGEQVFMLRRQFYTAKLTTWSAFLNGNPNYEECGFQAVTGISRSSALRYLAIYNAKQSLPPEIPQSFKDAIDSKLGTAFKAVQHGRVIDYLSTPEGIQYVSKIDPALLRDAATAAKEVNILLKTLRDTREGRTEQTSIAKLSSALKNIYLKAGEGKDKHEPVLTHATARYEFLLGLQRMAEDLTVLRGAIGAMDTYGMQVSVKLGRLPAAIAELEARPQTETA